MGQTISVDFDSTITTGEGDPWWVDSLDEEPRWDMISYRLATPCAPFLSFVEGVISINSAF